MNRSMTSKQSTRTRRGVAAVEFAVVAPVVFLAFFGLVEMGRMVMVKQAVVNAAREGCREAILATTINVADVDAVVRARLQNVVPNASDVNKLRVTCTPAVLSQATASGTEVTVEVECNFSDVSWTPGNFLGFSDTMAIRATATKERE